MDSISIKYMGICFIIEKTDNGFSAFYENLPIYTTGKTIKELENNIIEAIRLFNT